MPPKKSDKTLVIVESPGKIKKIQDILGDSYIVAASVGHIIDLSAKKMSIDIDNDFRPKYEYLPGKEKVINDLKRLAKLSSDILLATDEDREGEMIAWSLAHVLEIKDPKRITFNSITAEEILNAVKKPHKIDFDMVDAQKARRILDRIVGYEISPILWKSIGQALSAGRVQSVVVKLIIDRETEIDEFFNSKLKSFFNVTGKFLDKKKVPFTSVLFSTKKSKVQEIDTEEDVEDVKDLSSETETAKNGDLKQGSKFLLEDIKEVKQVLKSLQKSKFKIQGIGSRESLRNPAPPFTTSTLQQEASRKLGFAIKRTMSAAQNLYEAGHITYMRTDSVNLSKDAMKTITKYVLDKYGKSYSRPKEYKGKTSNSQEAHEAVRPTHVEHPEVNQKGKVGSDEAKLYQLIWKRSVASQMSPAVFNINTTQIGISELRDNFFSTEVSTVKFNGFLAVYDIKNLENENPEKNVDSYMKSIINK
jgi:DNA topoisomerase-1